ncbi:MAG: citrate transporter [Clostridiales bacterium]|jgi:Na+/H+ antiporter NhaD/arsenite permease-like protein|nr:citrate transporter [Clostridiales bacterium]
MTVDHIKRIRVDIPLKKEKPKTPKTRSASVSFLLNAAIFTASAVLAISAGIPMRRVMGSYQYNVLVILIVMELYTNLIVDTGIMQFIATRLALKSKGNMGRIMVFFGALMFIVSAFLNNITAVMVILPVIFVLLKAVEPSRAYTRVFFAVILSVSNTGGASSPIGDFPAIIIMTSGITTFVDYLIRAMPVFILTTAALITFWRLRIKKSSDAVTQELAVNLLHARHKHNKVDKGTLRPLCIILCLMFLAWSFAPQDIMPPEMVAVLGYAFAVLVCSLKGKAVRLHIDFKAVLTIAAFLLLASVIASTGILERLAAVLQTHITDPKMLLLAVMAITSVAAGLFSAGPAASAMMPVAANLCGSALASQTHWVAIAYAASICAGSSLFLWSATAGFILSSKIEEAKLEHGWGIGSYLKYGLVNFTIQLAIAAGVIIAVV